MAAMTPEIARAIYDSRDHLPPLEAAAKYGVSYRTVMRVRSGNQSATRTRQCRPSHASGEITVRDSRIEELIEECGDHEVACVMREALAMRRTLRWMVRDGDDR